MNNFNERMGKLKQLLKLGRHLTKAIALVSSLSESKNMIEKVRSLSEARAWFLSHASGEVLCVSQSGEKSSVCKTYKQAVEFYGN